MKLVDKKGLSGILEGFVWVLMGVGVAVLVALPWIVDHWMMPFNNDPEFWRPRYMWVLGVSGVMALLMLWQARCVMRNVNKGTIFSADTVKRLKIVGVEALVLAVFYAALLCLGMFKFSFGIIALVFLLAGMMALVFSEVFRQAMQYKQENDMTI